MKKTLLIAILTIAATVMSAAAGKPKVETKKIEKSKVTRLADPDDGPRDPGYEVTASIELNWPVKIGGKAVSPALYRRIYDEMFGLKDNGGKGLTYNTPIEKAADLWVKKLAYDNEMANAYTVVTDPRKLPKMTDENSFGRRWEFGESLKLDSEYEGNLIYFVDEYYQYLGGAHPWGSVTYYAYDIALAKPVALSDIITSESKLRRLLPQYDRRKSDLRCRDFSDVNVTNFKIHKGKITFYFQPYEIGSYAEGVVEIDIPLRKLAAKGLLTAYGKKFIK